MVIVGAGLVGTMLAIHLARRGAAGLSRSGRSMRRADIPGGTSLSDRGLAGLAPSASTARAA